MIFEENLKGFGLRIGGERCFLLNLVLLKIFEALYFFWLSFL